MLAGCFLVPAGPGVICMVPATEHNASTLISLMNIKNIYLTNFHHSPALHQQSGYHLPNCNNIVALGIVIVVFACMFV